MVYDPPTQAPYFELRPSSKRLKNTTFREPTLLPSSDKQAPNLADPQI